MKILLSLYTSFILLSAVNAAENKILPCQQIAGDVKINVRCEVDIVEDNSYKNVKGMSIPDGAIFPVTFSKGATEGSPTAVAIMFNHGLRNRVSPADISRLKQTITGVLDYDNAAIKYGLWSFGLKEKSISPIGTPTKTIKTELEKIGTQNEASHVIRNIDEVSKSLKEQTARRKILIIATDSVIEDDPRAFNIDNVLAKIRADGIRVIVIFPHDNSVAQKASLLNRIAEDNNGQFFQTFDTPTSQATIKTIKGSFENSGYLAFEAKNKPFKIDVTLNNDKTISLSQDKALGAPSSSIIDSVKGMSWLNISLLLLGLLILMGLLIYIIVKTVKSNKRKALAAKEVEAERTKTVAQMKAMLGWFEFFDGSGKKEPITLQATRIGRANDNDLVLNNNTVHRQHAILTKDSSGGFTIMDLDTENGVKVNGEHVKSVRLQDGDTIELGEVRMRFKIA